MEVPGIVPKVVGQPRGDPRPRADAGRAYRCRAGPGWSRRRRDCRPPCTKGKVIARMSAAAFLRLSALRGPARIEITEVSPRDGLQNRTGGCAYRR
ncbi:hypothetical protein ACTMU2_08095 [Cupriavidus basilensis]